MANLRTGRRQNPEWPPKSPHQAFQSSPSQQRRSQKRHLDRPSSPSPVKKPRHENTARDCEKQNGEERVDSDADEETLKLQIQTLQAQLRLKKIQKAKGRDKDGGISDEDNGGSVQPREALKKRAFPDGNAYKSPGPVIQVAHSPKRQPPPDLQQSPRRVQLGIDKGVKANEVSLKPVRSFQDRLNETQNRGHPRKERDVAGERPLPRGQSFSKKIAGARNSYLKRQEREERLQKARGSVFDIEEADVSHQGEEQARYKEWLTKKNTRKCLRNDGPAGQVDRDGSNSDPTIKEEFASDADQFSEFHLSKRRIQHGKLSKAFEGKSLYPIARLLKEVTAPEYELPDVEDDVVVFGIISSKSNPYDHAPTHRTHSTADPGEQSSASHRAKFMVLHLTDLEWELDLFLFGSAYDRFWKMTVGTIVAILNPGIMPPKPHMRDTGRFSLKLSSSEETVLEIGSAADLGFCKSIKKDGKECMQWIDRRKTEYCDFHVNLQVERSRASRMEINTMGGLGMFTRQPGRNGTQGSGGASKAKPSGRNSSGKSNRCKSQPGGGLKPEGSYYDREAREAAWLVPPELQRGLNTRQLLDVEDYGPDGRLNAAERSRRRRAWQEKERSLAAKLSTQGGGLGGEYLRSRKVPDGTDEGRPKVPKGHTNEDPADAKSLDLVGFRAEVHLSPVRKRKGGPLDEPVGWGRALKRGLSSPERAADPAIRKVGVGSEVKQARFLTDRKGVRFPGRSSLPDLGDDDELDIV